MEPKNREITITVEAKNLYGEPQVDSFVDKYTALSDDEGFSNRFGDSNVFYETGVFPGYNVTWKIEMANPNGEDKSYNVQLISVKHNPTKGNPNFFESEELFPGENLKQITGTISRAAANKTKPDTYTINFGICKDNTNWKNYPLDPKLQIRKRD